MRAGEWKPTPASPLSARHDALSIAIGDSFLVVGGRTGGLCPAGADCIVPMTAALRDGAIFSPDEGTWTTIAEAPVPVGDGSIVTAGDTVYLSTYDFGRGDTPASFLSYTPATDEWAVLPHPSFDLGELVTDGVSIISVLGSDEIAEAVDAIYSPGLTRWDVLPDDPLGPSFDREAVWTGSELLLTAKNLVDSPGSGEPSITRLSNFDLTHKSWTQLPDSDIIGGEPTAVNGSIVFPGDGRADGGAVNQWGHSYPFGAIFHPDTGRWDPLPAEDDPDPVLGVVVVDNRILLGGALVHPKTGATETIPPFPDVERENASVATSSSLIFVWGGNSGLTDMAGGAVLRP